ncbi:cytochrome c oxidase copper chaperone, putative [Plasmodium ovale]|uniref:Cytochrome c oxidase copper chaperone, putative n=2 Tax=Plasmodium ovale TaxID=36330 RepID=A0A1C3KPU9_PLAOA|nr:cytochrome c oxidase copper chaperone, putative (COX17) [Plasmodium ovale curtisi]SBT03040.1 cytochrome c oxidase copper chaperone, putative (COX17) [Plasmodium ovale curtisi]SBT76088.1 cytochrome c oxidase copper chaperone, putative [Plasmodium ovale]SCP03887.1 cytochrome c oxidase copper chaperone, putative [Plasmodium ovale]
MGASLNKAIRNTIDEVKGGEKKKKICCVCLETKKLRDECIVNFGEEKCKKLIDDHNQCLRNEGFDVK